MDHSPPLVPDSGSPTRGPQLMQAPIKPLDEDGMLVALIGTGLWLVATAVLLIAEADVRWTRVGVAGVMLGLVGAGWIQLRRRRRPLQN